LRENHTGLLRGYSLFEHPIVKNPNVLHDFIFMFSIPGPLSVIPARDTLRPLLLVLATSTPHLRNIELWFIIYVATRDF
jgi:hypothetical protein